jgi:hypothetical protein
MERKYSSFSMKNGNEIEKMEIETGFCGSETEFCGIET